jgi:hypothetical protein
MIAIAFLFVCMVCDCFKSRRRLEAEILVLRHQRNVMQQRAPRRLHLRWAGRALFIWLYRRCPRILDAVTIVRPEFRREVQHPSALSLLDFPFLGAAFGFRECRAS